MNYLVEVFIDDRGPPGWKPLRVFRQTSFMLLLRRQRELNPGDSIHDVRIKRLLPPQIDPAQASVVAFWGAP
jgi:hypothetical protein